MTRARPDAPSRGCRSGGMPEEQRLEVRRVRARSLTAAEKEAMWRCYSRFVEARRDGFMHTIDTADKVVLFYTRGRAELAGFEALRVLTVAVEGRPYTVVYSCYADLDRSVRGVNLLQRAALRETVRLKMRHPFRRIFWMFTASTYLSYLLLPNNLVEYWPRPASPIPPRLRELMDVVMRDLDKEGWDPDAGVVRRHGALRYREGVVGSDPALLANPHIRFYAALNPGQPEGDSLACLCPASARNFCALLAAMVQRAWSRARPPRPVVAHPSGAPPGSARAPR